MQISNEHFATESTTMNNVDYSDGSIRNQYEDFKYMRKIKKIKRSSAGNNLRDERRARMIQSKNDMKNAVKMAKSAGSAVEYKGPLSRATIVSSSFNLFHKVNK